VARCALVLDVVRTICGGRTPAPNRRASANQVPAVMPMGPFDDPAVYTGMPGPRKVRSVGRIRCLRPCTIADDGAHWGTKLSLPVGPATSVPLIGNEEPRRLVPGIDGVFGLGLFGEL